MFNNSFRQFENITARQWSAAAVVIGFIYLGLAIIVVYQPSVGSDLRPFWYVWALPGLVVWAMALLRMIYESLGHN